jgi:signal transduction histidine kinase
MVSGHDGDRSRRLKKELQATKVERKQIEAWWKAQVRALAEVDQEVAERVRQTLEMFHDVQTAASSIIRSAERLQAAQLGRNDDEKFAALHPAAQTLVKAASLLELRMRTMPIVSNPAAASYGRRIRKPIYKLIDMLVRTLQPLAERRGVSLELRGVSHKMTDVFESFDLLPLTLIENAIKYSAKGQAIEVVVQDTESGIAVSVASFSPWIAPEERQSIFKRRYRAESAITMLAEGSGLGLHIAEVVARAHNTHVLFGTDEGNVMLDGIRYAGNRFSFSTR